MGWRERLQCTWLFNTSIVNIYRAFAKCQALSQIHVVTYFSSVQSLSHVRLFVTPWTEALQASLSITNSWSPHNPLSNKSMIPSSHLILCHPLLLLPPIFPSIRVFSNESALHIRWPKYWSFSFNISPSNEHPGLNSFRMDIHNYSYEVGTLINPVPEVRNWSMGLLNVLLSITQ